MESREEKYLRAKERVRAIRKFYGSCIGFLVFNVFLAGLNYYTNGWSYMWFLWVTPFWAIGLVIEGMKTFGVALFFGKNWESKKIKEYMEEEAPKDDVRFNRWE